MRIPRFDHRAQYNALRSEILMAADRVFDSESLILGPQVAAFEQHVREYLNVPGFCVGTGNGTDALHAALRALGIGPGDDVITVANTAVATVSAIRLAGARPVFCDIDPQTLMMNAEDAARRITARTKAILPVHLFGNAADLSALIALARQRGLFVVEDCAQSFGTTFEGRLTGTWGDVGCFSFYPTKNLGAFGDGGMCFTRNPELAARIRRICTYGCGTEQAAVCEGFNSRLDEVQAAILDVKLRHLPYYLEQRRSIAAAYRRHLLSHISIPEKTPGAEHSHHLFVIQVEHRERIMAALRAAGIGCGIHYPVPVHLMEAYRFLDVKPGSLPVTESVAHRLLTLPCYPELSLESVREICGVVNRAAEGRGQN